MCQYFSAIKTEEKLLWLMDDMSHEAIIKHYKLNDKKDHPDFVRLEFLPKDSDIFNHDLSNWELKVDQDLIPDWFDADMKKVAIHELKEEIQKHWSQRFIVDGMKVDEIKCGVWYMNGGTLNDMLGGTLNNMRGGTLNNMRGGTLNVMRGGTLNNMWGGTLNNMWGGTLNVMNGGTLNDMWGGTLNNMRGGTLLSHNGTLPSKLSHECGYNPRIILPNEKKVIVPCKGWKVKVGLKG